MVKCFLSKERKDAVRVISGDRKGHKLKAPKGKEVRPTEDRIKESLFNIIRPIKKDAIILDLFSGSGSIGIEFLSRGSKLAYFVDASNVSILTIKENLIHTNLIDKSIILNKDAIRALSYFKEHKLRFDYIYLDPPFKEHKLLLSALEIIYNYELISNEGVIIVEHEKHLQLDERYFGLVRYDSRHYGSKSLSFYKISEVQQ